ncbi:unnamed protein product, partial [Owenia fusiformis]
VITSIVLLCTHTLNLLDGEFMKIVEPLQNYGRRPEVAYGLAVPQCKKSSKNLIGYQQDDRDENLIIYSKMPKCGSTTLYTIFKNMRHSSKHFITKKVVTPKPEALQTIESKRKYISTKILPRRPYIFIGHLSFLDFIELGYKQPLYIDVVRDPIDRWLSLYHYKRESSWRLKLTPNEIKQPLEECLKIWINQTGCSGMSLRATAECLKTQPYKGCRDEQIVSTYPLWFSGQYINSSLVSVQRAKTNIEKYYTFIGITERFDETVKAMETILPSFTNELSKAYASLKRKRANIGRNKVRPCNESIAVMKELLTDDYHLYGFIRQRFNVHLNCFGII